MNNLLIIYLYRFN